MRKFASWVQRIMRIATPYMGVTTCHLIHPNDCLSERMWEYHIESQGGEADAPDASKVFEAETLIESYEKLREEKTRQDDVLAIIGTSVADFDDNRRNVAAGKHYGYVRRFIDKFPLIGIDKTDAGVAIELRSLIEDIQANREPTVDLETQIKICHAEINDLAKEIASLRIGGYQPDRRDQFQSAIREVFFRALRATNIESITGVSDIGVLQRVKQELQRELVREKSQAAS